MNNLPRYGRTLEQRLLQHVEFDPNAGCWLWFSSTDKYGYGRIREKRKNCRAHVLSFQTFRGDIGAGQHVLHRCDTPQCINPDHLWAGTPSDNMKDMYEKGRHARFSPKTRQIQNRAALQAALEGEG